MGKMLTWLAVHKNKLIKAICGLSVGLLLAWGITTSIQNKKLSESLEMAQNNIEAYQGSLKESQQANNVLRISLDELQDQNDALLYKVDSVMKQTKIKPKQLYTAATQTQLIDVMNGKGVGGDLTEILRDTIYNDTLRYNDLTTIYYTIGKDTVNMKLDIKNTQYLYLYTDRQYKNKKSFIKRLFTLDFKKVNKYKYNIVNTNDLVRTDDVRVIEIIKK